MNRSQKIHKLSNAVKDWRGLRDVGRGRWIKPPQPHALQRVINWCQRLGLGPYAVEKIQSFQSVDDFNAWLKTL